MGLIFSPGLWQRSLSTSPASKVGLFQGILQPAIEESLLKLRDNHASSLLRFLQWYFIDYGTKSKFLTAPWICSFSRLGSCLIFQPLVLTGFYLPASYFVICTEVLSISIINRNLSYLWVFAHAMPFFWNVSQLRHHLCSGTFSDFSSQKLLHPPLGYPSQKTYLTVANEVLTCISSARFRVP